MMRAAVLCRAVPPMTTPQVWVLDSNVGPVTRDSGDVERVIEHVKHIPLPVPSRDWLDGHLAQKGLSLALRAWLASNLVPDGHGAWKWGFNIQGVAVCLPAPTPICLPLAVRPSVCLSAWLAVEPVHLTVRPSMCSASASALLRPLSCAAALHLHSGLHEFAPAANVPGSQELCSVCVDRNDKWFPRTLSCGLG
jgi:hypothetical protein